MATSNTPSHSYSRDRAVRSGLALLVSALLLTALGAVLSTNQPARGNVGLMGAVGCSQTRDVFEGLDAISAPGYWSSLHIKGYGGGALYEWADLNGDYWPKLQEALNKNPGTDEIWIEFCIRDRQDPTATADDLAAGVAIVQNVAKLAPGTDLYVSAMNGYDGIVCSSSGAGGPAVSKEIADHVVAMGLAAAGPVVGPLDASTVRADDGCHANDEGKILQAEQMEAFFGSGSGTTTTTTSTPGPGGFDDIAGTTFEADIVWLSEQGITKGCNPPTNSLFCPATSVTRGEMATFLVRALELPAASQDYFTDDDTSVHEANINSLAMAGITLGCNPPAGDEFCPGSTVTRAEMASFLTRAFNLSASVSDLFTDDEGSVHEANINALGSSGITKGCGATTYCPDDDVTRGQMAAFLHRAKTK